LMALPSGLWSAPVAFRLARSKKRSADICVFIRYRNSLSCSGMEREFFFVQSHHFDQNVSRQPPHFQTHNQLKIVLFGLAQDHYFSGMKFIV
ncbi:MAG: hypothetical protein KDG51_05290, partial [Calditrichaeota bacterium]|nr:hypothetical protein [Calditrichota bacterium]